MAKYFCFRFDVDTHACLKKGTGSLLHLGQNLETSFTFYINMGRAVSQVGSLIRILKSLFEPQALASEDKIYLLPARVKLGLLGYLRVALLNPLAGEKYLNIVHNIHSFGHEVGLHGGKNHELWHHSAHNWDEGKIESEISYALNLLKRINIHPQGFASPGWNGPACLPKLLSHLNFKYLADRHGLGEEKVGFVNEKLYTLPTNIIGEPGGVAYLEWCRAKMMTDKDILDHFTKRLESIGPLAVVYEHPYYAGVQELPMIEKLITLARKNDRQVVTMKHALEELTQGKNS